MGVSLIRHGKASAMIFTGAFFTVVVLLWPIFMVLSETEGNIQEQLLTIGENPTLYVVNFVIASMIAPALTWVMVSLAFFSPVKKATRIFDWVGALLLVPYVTFVSISYVSQYTLLQNYLSIGDIDKSTQWYFNNIDSLPYFINQLGYTFFAFSALFIGFKLFYEKGIQRAIGVLLWLSALLSIIAFVGLIVRSEVLNSSTILSGIITLPIGILVVILGLKLKRTPYTG